MDILLVHSLSIVTINRNNSIGLKKTLVSIVKQTYSRIELIIVDGASCDDSLDVVKSVIASSNGQIKFITISEHDSGIYNAMNKGLKYATGEYIFFLNSGDIFFDNQVIEHVVSNFNNEDVIYGNICVTQDGNIKVLKSNPEIRFFEKYQHDMPPQPATFFRKVKILEIGGFDERYKIVSDVLFIMKLFNNKYLNYKFIDMPITVFDLSGVSSRLENEILIFNERKNFILEYFPNYFDDFEKFYSWKKLVYSQNIIRLIFLFFAKLNRLFNNIYNHIRSNFTIKF